MQLTIFHIRHVVPVPLIEIGSLVLLNLFIFLFVFVCYSYYYCNNNNYYYSIYLNIVCNKA